MSLRLIHWKILLNTIIKYEKSEQNIDFLEYTHSVSI